MAKTDQKTAFQLVAHKPQITQQQYDHSIEDASYTYNKYIKHITIIHDNLNKQDINRHEIEQIEELETWLKHFKNETIKHMEQTTTILQKQHKKQPKYNKKEATAIKQQIRKEKTEIERQYKQTKQEIIRRMQQTRKKKTGEIKEITQTTEKKKKKKKHISYQEQNSH